jgi:pyrroline-5-carboxylate reductase
MTEDRLAFIGAGRITCILLCGLQRVGRLRGRVIVCDTDPAAVERLRSALPGCNIAPTRLCEAASVDTVFLALHPPALPTALAEMRGALHPEAVLVSLAPKWTSARISAALGGFERLARAIPNAPSIVNRGYNPIAFAPGLPEAERGRLRDLFSCWGAAPEVPERDLEAYAVLTGMGPTYFWYQLYELADLGRSFGLAPEAVTPALAAMVEGTSRTMSESGLSPAEVMDLVPVRPLSAIEPTVKDAYVTTLAGLYRKLTAAS